MVFPDFVRHLKSCPDYGVLIAELKLARATESNKKLRTSTRVLITNDKKSDIQTKLSIKKLFAQLER